MITSLADAYGAIEYATNPFEFDHTNYYVKEMGANLKKRFFCFEKLHPIDCFVDYKLLSLRLESRFMKDDKRTVNIDPGYLELAKLVLASTKNFDHRVYLNKGIYADVQLRYHGGGFIANVWTYPDYKEKGVVEFFTKIRSSYLNELRKKQP